MPKKSKSDFQIKINLLIKQKNDQLISEVKFKMNYNEGFGKLICKFKTNFKIKMFYVSKRLEKFNKTN